DFHVTGVQTCALPIFERRTGVETRVSVLGYTQRGGSPTAHDRVLATRYGVYAADMVARKEWGQMAALQGNEIVSVPLADATREQIGRASCRERGERRE